MQKWLRLGNTVINLDQVQLITDSGNGISVYFAGDKQPKNYNPDTPEARALTQWLKTIGSPTADGTEGVNYSSRVY